MGILGRTLAVAVALLTLAACGKSSTRDAASPTAPSTPSPSATTTATTCGPGATPLVLAGPNGVQVETDSIGSGRTAVVLLHEAGSTGMCGGWPLAQRLSRDWHVQVLLFSRCLYGATVCPDSLQPGAGQLMATAQPVVDQARSAGARRVVLVGASSGASDAIQVGARLRGVDAVVALSEDVVDDGGTPDFARATLPTLMMYAPGDRLCPPFVQRSDFGRIGARTKRLVVVPSQGAHGWDLVTADSPATRQALKQVGRWVTGSYR